MLIIIIKIKIIFRFMQKRNLFEKWRDAMREKIHYSSMQVYKNNVHQHQSVFIKVKYLSLKNGPQILK